MGSGAFNAAINGGFGENEVITVDLNLVYGEQYTRQQVTESMKPQLRDLADTFGRIKIQFNVTYSTGTVNSTRTQIMSGAVEGSLNVFYFDDAKNLYSYSRYEPSSRQIFISQKKGSDPIREGTLSHEVGHAFGLRGSITSMAVHYFGESGNNKVTNTIDNVTSDIQIEGANAWLRNGLALYGRDWVDDYRTATTTTHALLNPWQAWKLGAKPRYRITKTPRTPTILDLYRDGARQIANQKQR